LLNPFLNRSPRVLAKLCAAPGMVAHSTPDFGQHVMMDRRRFLTAAGAVATGCFGTARAQPGLLRFADMHSHIGMRSPTRIREVMSANGMLLLARKIVADAPVIRALPGQGYRMVREPNPGELAQRFDDWFARLHR